MLAVKRMILDVLKPHQPNALEFCKTIAKAGSDYRVRLTVLEIDEKTETLQLEITASNIDFEVIQATISDIGGSLHSVDEVEVQNESNTE
ncbi:MAG: DUF211 domain-containing protein [Gammaproteobacteria bacterium]|nr:DUF211 domain-containing protein [Gammaproteobacteria bacterium]MCW8986214.1 DUF211 domain-containing protein [Gammaproteobacteria bacterium]MCW9031924.1 DUF211 domain-containing protein [Gammaproteobacteria bacterium]